MGRIYVSGINDAAVAALGAGVVEVISDLDPATDGRIFYLTQLIVANESLTATADAELWDVDEAAVSDDATTSRGQIIIGPGDSVKLNWPDGAMPFVINCCISTETGTIGIGSVQGSGYLA